MGIERRENLFDDVFVYRLTCDKCFDRMDIAINRRDVEKRADDPQRTGIIAQMELAVEDKAIIRHILNVKAEGWHVVYDAYNAYTKTKTEEITGTCICPKCAAKEGKSRW